MVNEIIKIKAEASKNIKGALASMFETTSDNILGILGEPNEYSIKVDTYNEAGFLEKAELLGFKNSYFEYPYGIIRI